MTDFCALSQSNLILPHKGLFLAVLLLMLSTLFLSSCTSTPQKLVVTPPVLETNTTDDNALKRLTADQTLTLASKAPPSEAKTLLIKSADLYLQENNNAKALWLSNQLLALVVTEQERYLLLLIKAQSLQSAGSSDLATQVLTKIDESYPHSALTARYFHVSSDVYLSLDKEILSIDAKLRASALLNTTSNMHTAHAKNELTEQQSAMSIFQAIELLPLWKLDSLKAKKAPHVNGWIQLLSRSQYEQPGSMAQRKQLTLWSNKYPNHPAQILIPYLEKGIEVDDRQQQSDRVKELHITTTEKSLTNDLSDDNLATGGVFDKSLTETAPNDTSLKAFNEPFENIAILLPLSGSQQRAGLAVQQGILAAYHDKMDKKLHFYDENQLDWSMLQEKLSTAEIDFVVGPLLRSSVNKYLAVAENPLPSLLLNIPKDMTLESNQFAFSMRPEDEATQAAWVLSEQKYINPIVLSHADPVSERIAQAFAETWFKRTGITVDIHHFNQGRKMQENLQQGFDVTASKDRIKHVKKMLSYPIKSESRNRRDIDMIYLVGTTAQTKLVKPFIDVNTSRFSKKIPVYASSRSHDGDDNSTTNSDLNGLVFTESPWFISSAKQNKSLRKLSKQLYPNRSGSLSRIFAMGYDSYGLIDNVLSMHYAPYLRYPGQTGTLHLQDNILTRSFLWGKYQPNGVKATKLN